ncbi:MAG: hypothetical protein IKO27_02080 [Ruminococcus sp.]|nr:hypothetical protein [Ruminococcus sp.]
MTPEQLYTILSEHFPTCQYDWSEVSPDERPKSPPYCAILELKPDTLDADDKAYYSRPTYAVELYTKRRDYTSEGLIESIFERNDIYYIKSARVYLREEKKMQIVYNI